MLGHEMAHRSEGCPAWEGVVTDIEHAANLELAAYEIDDHGAILVRDPTPDTVQADVVKLRKVGSMTKIGKGLVIQMHGCAAGHTEFLRKSRLRGVEVRAVPRGDRGRRMNIGAQTLTKPKLARDANVGTDQTVAQESQLDSVGIEFLIVAKSVTNVGHIASGPVAHVLG